MKKRAIISLIVAAALILCGGVLIFWGLQSVNFDFSQETAKSYVVNDTFQSIDIETDTCDVVLVKNDKEFQVVCPDSEKLSCAVIAEDGVLKISVVDIRHWTDWISVFTPKMQVTVYLPESRYEQLKINTNTGHITVPEDFSFTSAEVIATTSDIDFSAAVENLLTATVSTGDVTVFGSSPDIMRITTTTGDVLLDNCSSTEVNIKTTTGNVTGHFLCPMHFITDTSTGNVDVPSGQEGGQCRITTTTGDIIFS